MDLDLTDNYLKIILLHIVLGILIFLVPVFSILFSFSIFIVGFIYVIKTQNRNNEV
jgi:hypothetical protein